MYPHTLISISLAYTSEVQQRMFSQPQMEFFAIYIYHWHLDQGICSSSKCLNSSLKQLPKVCGFPSFLTTYARPPFEAPLVQLEHVRRPRIDVWYSRERVRSTVKMICCWPSSWLGTAFSVTKNTSSSPRSMLLLRWTWQRKATVLYLPLAVTQAFSNLRCSHLPDQYYYTSHAT